MTDTPQSGSTVVRTGVSPMNPRVKWAELSCGHDVYLSRKPRVGSVLACEKCKTTSKREER